MQATNLSDLDFRVLKNAFQKAMPTLSELDPSANCEYCLDLFRLIKRVKDCSESASGMTWAQLKSQFEACPLAVIRLDSFLHALHGTQQFDNSEEYRHSVFTFQRFISNYYIQGQADLTKASQSELDGVFGKTSIFDGQGLFSGLKYNKSHKESEGD